MLEGLRFPGPRIIGHPQCGYFRTRRVRGGPLLPARIYLPCPWVQPDLWINPADWCRPLDRPRHLRAEIAGEEADPQEVWINETITRSEFEYRMRVIRWAKQYAPHEPEANPTTPVDLTKRDSLF